ncbi:MAG TPA: hypothetical protein VM096_08440 [Vicinamibacterales bacterium]|nr:hypothetical protein [Vicinamibacterales bacterium]
MSRDLSRRSGAKADRDRILEQALKHELEGVGTPPGSPALRSFSEGGCLDAETLAAWADEGLDAAATAACEAHVANCARCQSLVGTLARSLPASTESTLGTQGTPGTLSMWRWWLAPIAAGAAAVTLWMVVPEQLQVAVAPPHAERTIAADAPARAPQALPPPALDQSAGRARNEARDTLANAARADEPQSQLRDAAAPKEEEAKKITESVDVRPQAAAPPPPATVALGATAGALQKSARAAFAPIEVFTLERSRRWRILADRIERTEDDGMTWKTAGEVPLGQAIAAGSAPASSVAWFAGTRGLVLLTVNAGASFMNVNLPEPLDIASISATDARTAIISTVSGRRFRTDDGGHSWRPY